MKKSKFVNLVLVAGLVASCSQHGNQDRNSRLYVRGDSTSGYSQTPRTHGSHFFYCSPYGMYSPYGGFRHGGYASSGFSSKASNHISRGGFGSSGIHVGS